MRMKTAPRLGPGALERITLQLAKRPYHYLGDRTLGRVGNHFHMAVRVTGWYTVYCGNGWDHTVEIADTFDLDRNSDLWDDLLAAYDGDADATYRLAGALVDWALENENWSDPCEAEAMFAEVE